MAYLGPQRALKAHYLRIHLLARIIVDRLIANSPKKIRGPLVYPTTEEPIRPVNAGAPLELDDSWTILSKRSKVLLRPFE